MWQLFQVQEHKTRKGVVANFIASRKGGGGGGGAKLLVRVEVLMVLEEPGFAIAEGGPVEELWTICASNLTSI